MSGPGPFLSVRKAGHPWPAFLLRLLCFHRSSNESANGVGARSWGGPAAPARAQLITDLDEQGQPLVRSLESLRDLD
jgi:hypothetical protein